MAKTGILLAVAACCAQCPAGQVDKFTLLGGCDELASITFFKMGSTLSGAPYYKATSTDIYMYWDPDCSGSTDGTPRWIIDHDEPATDLEHDLDYDGACGYVARIDSVDRTQPPTEGSWMVLCSDEMVTKRLTLDVGSSTTTRTRSTTKTTTTFGTTPKVPTALQLTGACDEKGFLNGKTFEKMGTTADKRPYYKALNENLYLYYDSDCDAQGPADLGRWVLDDNRPNTTASQDLDGDRQCQYHARWTGGSFLPPALGSWKMFCGAEGWVSLDLSFLDISTKATHNIVTSASAQKHVLGLVFGFVALMMSR